MFDNRLIIDYYVHLDTKSKGLGYVLSLGASVLDQNEITFA